MSTPGGVVLIEDPVSTPGGGATTIHATNAAAP